MARLYISGRVTGIYKDNRPAFEKASLDLDQAGYVTYIPHDIVSAGTPWPMAMLISLHDLTSLGKVYGIERSFPYYDGVALLPGWEQSDGARLEKAVAEACGIPVKTVEEWLEVAR